MALSECKKIKGRSFTARRLNLAELRQVLEQVETRSATASLDLVDYLIEDGLPHEAFYLSLQIKPDALLDELDGEDPLDEEDILTLMEMVAKVNPTFAEADKRSRARLMEQVLHLENLMRSAQTSSSSVSATSGTRTSSNSKTSSSDLTNEQRGKIAKDS